MDFVRDLNTNLEKVTIWSNPDVAQEFPSQTVDSLVNLSEYKAYEVVYNRASSSSAGRATSYTTGKIPMGKATMLHLMNKYGYVRLVNIPNQTTNQITFNDCQHPAEYGSNTMSTVNEALIPWYIVGHKKL